MPLKKPLVIVTRKLPDVVETRMMELFESRLSADDHPMTREELVAAAQQADVLVPGHGPAVFGAARVRQLLGDGAKLLDTIVTTAEAPKLPSNRPRAPSCANTTSATVNATVMPTFAAEASTYARVRSSTRSCV